jgi:hypothetical protein
MFNKHAGVRVRVVLRSILIALRLECTLASPPVAPSLDRAATARRPERAIRSSEKVTPWVRRRWNAG